MTNYKTTNTTDNETHYFTAKSDHEARHWVINHLDMSKEWTYEKDTRKTLSIDFDGTLCKKQSFGNGEIHECPNEGAVEAMKKLQEAGYRLHIFSARFSPEFGEEGVDEKMMAVEIWLKVWDVPYDKITNNKYDSIAYIDDRAIRFTNWRDISNYFIQ